VGGKAEIDVELLLCSGGAAPGIGEEPMLEDLKDLDDAAKLRAALAASGFRLYVIAARLGVHPALLTLYLHGKRPIPSDFPARVSTAIKALREAASR
jgi:hypothetical protein